MNGTLQIINLILGIIVSCVAIGGALAKLRSGPSNSSYQTQDTIGSLSLARLRPKIWSIDRQRIVAMLLGATLYFAIQYIISKLDFSTTGPDWVYYLPNAVVLFFGAAFGPLVGLFVGAAGAILFVQITGPNFSYPQNFVVGVAVGSAVIGFIAGLSLIFTRGRFDKIRSIVAVEIIGAIGIIIGDLCYAIITQTQYNTQSFLSVIQADLITSLVLLPIILIPYGQQPGYQQPDYQPPYGQQPYNYQQPGAAGASGPTSMGMQPNVAAGLSYVLGLITGIIIFLMEKQNRFVRFHAMQSILFFGGLTVLSIILSIIGGLDISLSSAIAGVLSSVIGIVGFVGWIILLINGFQGKYFKLPIVGDYAEKYANQGTM
jgi:uncharacterized membrane protein